MASLYLWVRCAPSGRREQPLGQCAHRGVAHALRNNCIARVNVGCENLSMELIMKRNTNASKINNIFQTIQFLEVLHVHFDSLWMWSGQPVPIFTVINHLDNKNISIILVLRKFIAWFYFALLNPCFSKCMVSPQRSDTNKCKSSNICYSETRSSCEFNWFWGSSDACDSWEQGLFPNWHTLQWTKYIFVYPYVRVYEQHTAVSTHLFNSIV